MSDRIAVMSEGKVEQIGTPTEVYHRPATVFVANFIGQANLWPCRVESMADGTATVTALGQTLPAACDVDGIGPGSDATLMIRPERVHVVPVGGATPRPATAVGVTITSLVFQGAVVRLAGEAPDGSPVLAHIGADVDLPLLRPGDEVVVDWSPSAARVLPPASIPDNTRDLAP